MKIETEKRMKLTVYGKDYFNKNNCKVILRGDIKRIGHFGVVRDYTITLDGGQLIEIDADAVKIIAEDWLKDQRGEAKCEKEAAK